MRCALRTQTRLFGTGTMASPDVFLSSSPRRSRQYIVPSSSPDLPSIQDLLPREVSRPAIESGGKTTAITDPATPAFSGVRDLWRSTQAARVNQSTLSQESNPHIVIEDNDPATKSIGLAASSKISPRRPCRPNGRLEAIRQSIQQETRPEAAMETTQQPWKKFKPKTPEKDAVRPSENSDAACVSSISPAAYTALSDDITRTCSPMQDSLLSAQPRARPWESEEPLQLEPAMVRRKDWTPPKHTTTTTCDDSAESSAPTIDSIKSNDDHDYAKMTSFETLLTAYKCSDSAIGESASHQSAGSATKRRRLNGVEPVQSTLVPPIPVASTVAKKKAPRKKPRTITALATAAYKQATQADCDGGAAAAQETNGRPLTLPGQAAVQTKAKEKPRKRPTKPKNNKKAKVLPPKPILFSPETALKQVAQQDFVFGTSSQLAREQSPTFLRDLQRAMKSSNQLDEILYSTPLNSDSIEPPECRPKLWDAAARDADGDLFDVEVINLTESDACAPPTPREDPFGYCKGDTGLSPQQLPSIAEQAIDASAMDDDGFVDLSDILPAPLGTLLSAPEMPGIDRFPTCSPSPEVQVDSHAVVPLVSNQSYMQTPDMSVSAPAANHDTRPAFEDYTDTQLSTAVSRYGFKPIKRRSAMLALLEQCWQQTLEHSGHHVRMKSTAATSSKLKASSPEKRPRGRPRKDSGSLKDCESQEPPPSAQAPETSKQPRGRPRKDSRLLKGCESQEPPPSAQAPETPKRPRGRPRKDSGSLKDCESQEPPPSAQAPETSKQPRGRPRKDSGSLKKGGSQESLPSVEALETSKRPRGRPRVNSGSLNNGESQEPPPSAQAPETPKRHGARSKKDAEISPSIGKTSKGKTISRQKATPQKTRKATPKKARKATPKKAKKAAPKTRKAKSEKAKTGTKVIEIPDSDSDMTDILKAFRSSSRSRSSSRRRSIDSTTTLGKDTELSLGMTFTDSENNMLEYISRAITTAPRSTVPTEPSWHEKILLYDPIILEDLTVWLNSGQLTRVGCDEEANPTDVKKWCESKSICCLWKVTSRGNDRKRY